MENKIYVHKETKVIRSENDYKCFTDKEKQQFEIMKQVFTDEGLKRASQHNFIQSEANYNAKWFKRGGLFGYQKAKEENKELIEVFKKMLNCLEQANFYQRKPDFIIQEAKEVLLKTKCSNLNSYIPAIKWPQSIQIWLALCHKRLWYLFS